MARMARNDRPGSMKAFCFPDSAIAAFPAGVHATAAGAAAAMAPVVDDNYLGKRVVAVGPRRQRHGFRITGLPANACE
jgi:hypothetical protein